MRELDYTIRLRLRITFSHPTESAGLALKRISPLVCSHLHGLGDILSSAFITLQLLHLSAFRKLFSWLNPFVTTPPTFSSGPGGGMSLRSLNLATGPHHIFLDTKGTSASSQRPLHVAMGCMKSCCGRSRALPDGSIRELRVDGHLVSSP